MARKTKEDRAAYMRDYRSRKAVPVTGGATVEPGVQAPVAFPGAAPPVSRPPFLAAPVDECPLCRHDRQEADHLGGRPCKFKTSPRRSCGCSFEGF